MSMDFSEFRLRLGAEPRRQDDEVRAARDASAEFEAEASAAELFEDRLEQAFNVQVPDGLLESLADISSDSHEILNNLGRVDFKVIQLRVIWIRWMLTKMVDSKSRCNRITFNISSNP